MQLCAYSHMSSCVQTQSVLLDLYEVIGKSYITFSFVQEDIQNWNYEFLDSNF